MVRKIAGIIFLFFGCLMPHVQGTLEIELDSVTYSVANDTITDATQVSATNDHGSTEIYLVGGFTLLSGNMVWQDEFYTLPTHSNGVNNAKIYPSLLSLHIGLSGKDYQVAIPITDANAVKAMHIDSLTSTITLTSISLINGFTLFWGTIALHWKDLIYSLPRPKTDSYNNKVYGVLTYAPAASVTVKIAGNSSDTYTINANVTNASETSITKINGQAPASASTRTLIGGFTLLSGKMLWSDPDNPRIAGDIEVENGATLDIYSATLNLSGTDGVNGTNASTTDGSNGRTGANGITLTVKEGGTLELWETVLFTAGNGGMGGKGGNATTSAAGKSGGTGGKGGNGGTLIVDGSLQIESTTTINLIQGNGGTGGAKGSSNGNNNGGNGGKGGDGGDGGVVRLGAKGTIESF